MERELRRASDGAVAIGTPRKGPRISKQPRAEPAESSLTLALPSITAGSIIEEAVFAVRAGLSGLSPITSVAVIRAGTLPSSTPEPSATACIIDFQRMRTVRHLSIQQVPGADPVEIHDLRPWLGTAFGRVKLVSGSATSQAFAEVQTERLLVVSDASVAELEEHGRIILPTPPADLEIMLGATRLWGRPGPVRVEAGGQFSIDVELTKELQAAVDAAAPGDFPLALVLNAGSPGDLGFSVKTLTVSQVYPVPLPDRGGKSVVFDAEGRQTLSLPLAADSASWTVSHVRAVVDAKIPLERIVPAEGPALTDDAELVLDADRAVAVLLPSAQLATFDSLSGVRLPVFVDEGSAELVGVLRADLGGVAGPGAPVDGPSLGPVTIEARPRDGGEPWITLALPRPRKLTPGAPLWLVLQVSRGRVCLRVSIPPAAPANPLWRGLPNGPFKVVPSLPGAWPMGLEGAVRLVGASAPDDPVDALKVWVTGSSQGVEFTPSSDGVVMNLDVTSRPAGTTLPLLIVASTPGGYRFRDVEVIYR